MQCTKEYRLSCTDKAEEIVSKMSLEEKVHLMSGQVSMEQMMKDAEIPGRHYNWIPYPAGGNERLGVPAMKFVDGPRGVVCNNSTCFPVSMARGAAFDMDLEERIGKPLLGKRLRWQSFQGVCINPHIILGGAARSIWRRFFSFGQMGLLQQGVRSIM